MNSVTQCRTVKPSQRRSLRILVVDDSAPFGDLAAALLEREPSVNVVGVVRSGAAALDAVAVHRPDVVLMDVQMSPMSGLTAAALVWWLFPETQVVMMSTEDSPRLRAECAASGAVAFIHKHDFVSEFLVAVGPAVRGRVRRVAAGTAASAIASA
jgi:DNA-binding NarL/FixJ family response regulator